MCLGGRRNRLSAVNTMMSPPVITRVLSLIVVAVMPVIVVAVSRRGRGCDKARDRSYGSADCRAQGRAVTASSRSPDCSPTACADETAANETLHRIVRIGASRQA
jgi:hypothetical protein